MIDIEVSCSKCRKELPVVLSIEQKQDFNIIRLQVTVENEGWIFRVNNMGSVMTYCSKECAK